MITVIIITHNYKKFLDKCIKSVLRNNLKIVNEIIVIDDNSIDGTFKYLNCGISARVMNFLLIAMSLYIFFTAAIV